MMPSIPLCSRHSSINILCSPIVFIIDHFLQLRLSLIYKMNGSLVSACLLAVLAVSQAAGPLFAPYYDTFLEGRPGLLNISTKTGQKSYHLAFALGGDCKPTWGAKYELDDPEVLAPIKELIAQGAEMIVATGGALGPYLENSCTSVESLTTAYKTILDTVGTTHIDVDVESSINLDQMNQALAQLQSERPSTTVSFTLMVQAEDYGVTPGLGYDLLVNAKANGVRVDIVNIMAMEFWATSPSWGDAVINASLSTLLQLKEIWPEKSDAELKKMLGVTPMIGRNFNGKTFETAHARQLVDWANENHIGLLAFWSSGRDNGDCPGGVVSPFCSGTTQSEFEFTQIFQGFTG